MTTSGILSGTRDGRSSSQGGLLLAPWVDVVLVCLPISKVVYVLSLICEGGGIPRRPP